MSTELAYQWEITVRRWDTYGQKVVATTPAAILAADRNEVTEKVRAAFNATYDDFRQFWSHDWALREMREVQSPTPPVRLDGLDA